MCGVPSTLLSGEVVRLSLEVHNVGHVPLNSLRLSSSLGPRLLLDTVGVTSVNILKYPLFWYHLEAISETAFMKDKGIKTWYLKNTIGDIGSRSII